MGAIIDPELRSHACEMQPLRLHTARSFDERLCCWEPPQACLALAAARFLRSDERVKHDFPDLLREAAGDSELGSPLQRLLP